MNLFVAKLSFRTREDQLRQLFEQFGQVSSAKIIFDKATGRSKGYGFVEMADDSAGRQAIAQLNETEFDGRTIVVKESTPRDNQ
jgi:RNA recognition motif-containing protein